MEKYKLNGNGSIISITQGRYYNKIFSKHVINYGETGAHNIRDNILSTFREALLQFRSPELNNNMLLVGKVQSGKTSNLELFTALALDNGFNLVVIYGGYDSTLLSQTTERFQNTFDIPKSVDYSNTTPVIFSSDDSKELLSVDNEIVEDLLEAQKPIFLISMKRPAALKKVNALLKRIDRSNIRAFIIDDEGDQASLNTEKDKKNKESATYQRIGEMKTLLNDPLYLSVTATPQANIFLDEYSKLRPDSIRLIEPGAGYCGAEAYHLFDSEIINLISDEEQDVMATNKIPISLKYAIHHYIIASAIMHKRGIIKSDMIVHSHRNVADHSVIYNSVEAYIQEFKDIIEYEQDDINIRLRELEKSYTTLFPEETRKQYPFENLKDIICKKIVRRIYVILKNSTGQVTQATEKLRNHKIYIGGDLLQRGVTFSNLVTTYFSRWAMSGGNMDTNLQRARWFGYRSKYLDLCRIFTTETIAREFTNLSEIESDLWEQFYEIQNKERSIDDILIRADDTKQKPTRSNVATFKTVKFKNRWLKQRVAIFDLLQLKENNTVIEQFINELDFSSTSVGRVDDKNSAEYAIVDSSKLKSLIDQIQMVFDLEPFEKGSIRELLNSTINIPIIKMDDIEGRGRARSFYNDNKIYALHQGADNKDKSKAKYLGDSFVIIDKDTVNIQIHKILPKKNGVELKEYTQYMFAIYIPKEKTYFAKG